MKYLKYLIIILCFISCKEKDPAPLSKEKFAAVLLDIHSVQGYKSVVRGRHYNNDEVDEFQLSILKKHNIDKALFDSCVVYYSRHIDIYSEIYEDVIDSLNKCKCKYDIIIAANYKRDTLDIWTGKDSLSFKDDSIKKYECDVPFREKGMYRLALKIKVNEKDKAIKNRLVGFFKTNTDSLISFDTIYVSKDTLWHKYYMKAITDSLEYESLHFKLMDCDNIDSLKTRDVIIKDIKLTNPLAPKVNASIYLLDESDLIKRRH